MSMDSLVRILTDSKYAVSVFAFGILLAIPMGLQSGMVDWPQFLILEVLFIFNLLSSAYIFWVKDGPLKKKDFFTNDFYLKELHLKTDMLYAICSGVMVFVGVPVTFLFDALSTIYSITSLFENPITDSIYSFAAETLWPYIYLLIFIAVFTVLVISLKKRLKKD